MNLMCVDGYSSHVQDDAEPVLFRGAILGLRRGADLYGTNPDELRQELKKSLDVSLAVCKDKGIEPRKHYSSKYNLRIPPDLQEKLAIPTQTQGKSLN